MRYVLGGKSTGRHGCWIYKIYDTIAECNIGEVLYDGDDVFFEAEECFFARKDLIEIADLLTKKYDALESGNDL